MSGPTRTETFVAERPRLTRLAYRYLGSVADAEDVVQDTWLRFAGAGAVEQPPAFLATIVTRLCLDRLRATARRRETYVGPWLPEPFVDATTPAQEAALDISYAVMRSLEALTPEERAAFFLHDLFEMPFAEIGPVLGRTPAGCRKLAERARRRIRAADRRFTPTPAQFEGFLAAFRRAVETNDLGAFKALLAEDVLFLSDGGGKVAAVRGPVQGADAVAKLILGLARAAAAGAGFDIRARTINDAPGALVYIDGRLDVTVSFDLDRSGAVTTFYLVRNPDKLAGVG